MLSQQINKFLEITDNRGIQIYKTALNEGSNRIDNELESGFYLVRAVKATESITLKINVL